MIGVSNLKHWIVEQGELNSDKPAIIFNSKEYSYYQILSLSKKSAEYFTLKGVKSKDHVIILSKNNIEFIIAVLGLWLIGAIPIPLNIRSNINEIEKLIRSSKSKFIVNILDIIELKNSSDYQIIVFNSELCDNEISSQYAFESDDVAIMLFTSGSTGTAKCVKLTFNNLFESVKSADGYIQHSINDTWLCSLPFYHIGGFSIITRTIISGCKLIIPNSLNYNDINKAILKFKPSLLSFVPTMLMKLINDSISPWNGLKILFVGGGPLSNILLKESLENSWPISLVYGSTETGSMVTVSSTENLKRYGLSAGTPLGNVEIIIDENKVKFDDELAGKIIISSKSVAEGYFNLSKDEDQQLIDGKYFSNDLGKIDKNGNLQIIGRKDDVIISGGENISLTEIFNLLNEESEFNECAVIGVKDEKWGESYVIITESKQVNIERRIREFLNKRLAKFKQPQSIISVKIIPKTDLGKIQKNELKKIVNLDFL